jgi:hypothetical protein
MLSQGRMPALALTEQYAQLGNACAVLLSNRAQLGANACTGIYGAMCSVREYLHWCLLCKTHRGNTSGGLMNP